MAEIEIVISILLFLSFIIFSYFLIRETIAGRKNPTPKMTNHAPRFKNVPNVMIHRIFE